MNSRPQGARLAWTGPVLVVAALGLCRWALVAALHRQLPSAGAWLSVPLGLLALAAMVAGLACILIGVSARAGQLRQQRRWRQAWRSRGPDDR